MTENNNMKKSLKGIINKQNVEIEKKNKIIDLMAEEISNSMINTCPLADYNFDLNCEERCKNQYKECWIEYFKKKAEEK